MFSMFSMIPHLWIFIYSYNHLFSFVIKAQIGGTVPLSSVLNSLKTLVGPWQFIFNHIHVCTHNNVHTVFNKSILLLLLNPSLNGVVGPMENGPKPPPLPSPPSWVRPEIGWCGWWWWGGGGGLTGHFLPSNRAAGHRFVGIVKSAPRQCFGF